MSHTKHKNPTTAAKVTLGVMMFGGLSLFLLIFAMRNIGKVKSFLSTVGDVNAKLDTLIPKLQTNVDKINKMTNSLIPSGFADILASKRK
jgi:hypothetical protein